MESKLFKKLKRHTGKGFHWQRHEDKLTPGIPDCSYGAGGIGGWVELKTYDSYPKNPKDPVNMPDIKPEQRNWMFKRGATQGRCFWLIEIKKDWYLIGYEWSRDLGNLTRKQLKECSHAYGTGPLKGIIKVLVKEEYR